jgi:hypothetical protein
MADMGITNNFFNYRPIFKNKHLSERCHQWLQYGVESPFEYRSDQSTFDTAKIKKKHKSASKNTRPRIRGSCSLVVSEKIKFWGWGSKNGRHGNR